uniref:Uncharacterized protein n=1 Tax=Salix viminalis TaxID=40686 RepID=A0A6N2LKS7_SALVM
MLPRRAGIITRAACLVPKNAPTRLTPTTFSNSALSLSSMFGFGVFSIIPALLNMMSSFPCWNSRADSIFDIFFLSNIAVDERG